ncbi:MAG: hypothetical protein NW217_05490 [Hyphomicrobiaceae bacterium]|nr:hypothetical protein [Hyphomicrobiaceae bacterium]
MSARVIELEKVRRSRREARATRETVATEVVAEATAGPANSGFVFWTGATGTRYIHTVYPLLTCPEMPRANIMLVKREGLTRRVLAVCRPAHDAPSLNLADVRQTAAQLGANEVHVHLLAGSDKQMKLVEFDLRTAHLCGAPAGDTRH